MNSTIWPLLIFDLLLTGVAVERELFCTRKKLEDLKNQIVVFSTKKAWMSNAMELVSKDGQEQHLGISCPRYMLDQVIEIPPRTVLLELMEAIGAKRSSIFTSIPCGSLRFKANEQVIEIPPRIVLLKVLEAIGAKVGPIFTCTPCGSLHYKVCVELDVPSSRFSVRKPPPVAKVEGEICDSPAQAETSAVMNALKYLGMGKAEYNNVPSDGGKVEGEVKFSFPCMVEGRFHKLEVHSQALASSRAEEVAARAALLFMESKLNVKIVDLNYAYRQIAEKKHKFLENIKDRYLEVAHQMKTQLGNMVEWIAGLCAAYSGDPRLMFGGPLSQEQMMAVEFCSNSLDVVRGDCATRYESSVSMFEEMEKISSRL